MQKKSQGTAFNEDLGDRMPIFDIKISAAKKATYSRMAQNELAIQLFTMGVFNPQLADQALALLEIMDFDGKEKIIKKVQENETMYEQMIQMQQQMQQMAAVIDKIGAYSGTQTNVSGEVGQQAERLNMPVPKAQAEKGTMTQAEQTADRARNAASVGGN